jgi:hypothetical protein
MKSLNTSARLFQMTIDVRMPVVWKTNRGSVEASNLHYKLRLAAKPFDLYRTSEAF